MVVVLRGKMDDDLLICPFNTSHLIHRSRMLNHAVKCGKAHKGSKRVCPFDPAHEVIEPEYRSHLLTCSKIFQLAKITDKCFGQLFASQSSTKRKAKKRKNKKNKQNCIPPKDPQDHNSKDDKSKDDNSSFLSTKDILKEENPVFVMEKTSTNEPQKPSAKSDDKSCQAINDILNNKNSVSVMEKLEEADGNLPLELDPAEESWTVVTGKKEAQQNKPKGDKKQNSKEENKSNCSDDASGDLAMNIAPLEENWDDLVGKVRYDPEKVSERKAVLRAPQGKTKTERKKFRKDERLRYNLLANNHKRPMA